MARNLRKVLAAGATLGAAGAAGLWVLFGGEHRVVRIEKSIQIGLPVAAVFAAWADLSRMPQYCEMIHSVHRSGDHSRWVAHIDGRTLRWDAELVQIIPNQAIGWKSLSGPKHTGRISFSPLGNDTVLHVQMNYAPPLRFVSRLAPVQQKVAEIVERALRDFKAALEGKGREFAAEEQSPTSSPRPEPATGTYNGE